MTTKIPWKKNTFEKKRKTANSRI